MTKAAVRRPKTEERSYCLLCQMPYEVFTRKWKGKVLHVVDCRCCGAEATCLHLEYMLKQSSGDGL